MRTSVCKYIIIFVLILYPFLVQGQNLEDNVVVRSYLDQVFENVDKTKVPTGYLRDYSFELVDFDRFDGSELHDSNYVNSEALELMLRSVRSAAVGVKPFDDASERLAQLFTADNEVPLAAAVYKYNYIRDDAESLGLLLIDGDKAYDQYDDNNNWLNPYAEKCVVGFAPLVDAVCGSNVTFACVGLFTNLSLSGMHLDLGDGNGFRSIGMGQRITTSYTTSGTYDLTLKVYLTGGGMLLAHSQITVELPGDVPTKSPGEEDYEEPQLIYVDTLLTDQSRVAARVRVLFNTTTGRMKKPFIIAEGFDPVFFTSKENVAIDEDGSSTFDYNSIPLSLRDAYDFVYIDWDNSLADLRHNAQLFKKIIVHINTLKKEAGSQEKNIVIGQSMGGLIARIALREMELENTPHETSCYVSHDSPHIGANVPLGALYLLSDLNVLINSMGSICRFIVNNTIREIPQVHKIAHSMAAKQMLANYVTEDGVLDNSCHLDFIDYLSELGFPQNAANLAIVKSGPNNTVLSSSDKLLSYDGTLLKDWYAYLAYQMIGQEHWKLVRGIGTNTRIEGKIDVWPHLSYNSLLSDVSITYSKKLFGENKIFNIISSKRFGPSTGLLYDSYPASIFSIPLDEDDINDSVNDEIIDLSSLYIIDEIPFVPTASALNINYGNNLSSTNFLRDFCQNPPSYPSETPFSAVKVSNSQETHTFGGSDVAENINWILSVAGLEVVGPVAPEQNDVFYVNNMKSSYSVQWSTSNSSVATIGTDGRINIVGSGIIMVNASVYGEDGKILTWLSKQVIVGFPAFTLTKMQPVAWDAAEYVVLATPNDSDFYDFVDPAGISYHWGLQYSGISDVSWNTETIWSETKTNRLAVDFDIYPTATYAFVYFYYTKGNDRSQTYMMRITNPSYSPEIPDFGLLVVNEEGELIHDDTGEIYDLQTKSDAGISYNLTIKEDGITYKLSSLMSVNQILASLCKDERFCSIVKMLKPWGDKQCIIKKMIFTDIDGNILEEKPLTIIYNADI